MAEACPRLSRTPLCTVGSFHTLGERMKIALSEKRSEKKEEGEEEASVTETCLGPEENTDGNDDAITRYTPTSLCSSLVHKTLTLTSSQYDTASEDLYRRSVLPVRRILRDLNLEIHEIDEVVMVGGSTRMPKIRDMVREELGVERLNVEIDPDLTVAYGAASVID